MLERFFERDAPGALKGLTLEWKCPDCAGLNFRILSQAERSAGAFHTHCRYCRAKFSVAYPPPVTPVEGEAAFIVGLDEEDFTVEETTELIRDFAEIASLKADHALPGMIREKERALAEKMDVFRRRRR